MKYDFNLNLLINIRNERRSITEYTIEEPLHHLISKKVLNHHDLWEGTIEKVYKQWYQGWYRVALINHDNSHFLWLFENICCHNETILKQIEESNFKYMVINE
jgi:tRNA nucleotidyltransferase/poly(A) polymerase